MMRLRRLRLSTETGVIVAVLLGFFLFMGGLFRRASEGANQATCLSTVKMTLCGISAYAHDWDDHLPRAGHLADVQWRYVFQYDGYIERCPDDHARQETSYAIPEVWSGKRLSALQQRQGAILLYEADHGTPAYRHSKGMNVGYADVSARWRAEDTLPPEAIRRGLDPNPEALPRWPGK